MESNGEVLNSLDFPIQLPSTGESEPRKSPLLERKASPSHLLVEGPCHAALKKPIKASSRIRYTCLSVSSSHIALGCSTGSIYVFERTSLQHVQMVSADVKDGSIVALSFALNGLSLAYATSAGILVIVDLHLEKRTKPDKLRVTTDHKGATVTALCWDERRLFVGDTKGLVTAVNSGSKASDLLKVPSEVIMRLDQPVVQIDVLQNRVLVSTTKSAYVANTSTHQFLHVGKKIRDGQYGACFYPVTGPNAAPIVYSARPGSRMWEASAEGDVFNTHQFKALLDVPPVNVIPKSLDSFSFESLPSCGPQSLAFNRLLLLGGHFILAMTSTHLIILDPADVKVVLWSTEVQDILCVVCLKREIYVLLPGNLVRMFTFTPVVKYLIEAHRKQSSQLALHHLFCQSEFWVLKTRSKQTEMLKITGELLQQNLTAEIKTEVERIHDELEKKVEITKEKEANKIFSRSESGIYVLERSSSIGSDDAENDALLERVRQRRSEDSDTVSISSNTSGADGQKIEERLREAKNKLTSLKNIIKNKVTRRVSNPGISDENPTPEVVTQSISEVTSPTELIAESPEVVKPSASSESLLSLETKGSDDDKGSRQLSRHGSFTSNDISVSSNEFFSGSPIDPEPVFAKSVASFSHKGKKMRTVTVDLDHTATASPSVTRKTRKSKRKPPKGHALKKSSSLPAQFEDDQIEQDEHSLGTSSQEIDAPQEQPPEVTNQSPPLVASTLNTVKDRVEGTARSFVHLIKEGASKVRGPPRSEAVEVDPKSIATLSKETVVWTDRSYLERVEEDYGLPDVADVPEGGEAPLVDLTKLREATTAAREELSSAANASILLQEWIPHMNEALQQHHKTLLGSETAQNETIDSPVTETKEETSDVKMTLEAPTDNKDVISQLSNPFFAKDPLRMDPALRDDVQLLTSLCLQHGLFGNISKYLSAAGTHEDERVVFVRCYFFLLKRDALERFVMNSLESREKMWNLVVDCEEVAGKWSQRLGVYAEKDDFQGAVNYVTYLKEKGRHKCLRGALPSLLKISPAECVHVAVKGKFNVLPMDFLYLLRRSAVSCPEALLASYAEQWVEYRENGLSEICSDDEVLIAVAESLLQHQVDEHSGVNSCSCGFPSPQEHRRRWKHCQLIDSMVAQEAKTSNAVDALKTLTYSHSFWTGHLQLIKDDQNSHQLLQMLLLQLADGKLLFSEFPPSSEDDWRKLVELRKIHTSSDDSPKCLKCGSPLQTVTDDVNVIPWEMIARGIIESFGVPKGWTLLRETQLPTHLLNADFFHQVIQAKAAEHKQSQLLNDLLKDFETNSTSKRCASLPVQVLMAAQLELQSTVKDVATSKLINQLLNCLESSESPSGHWSSNLEITRSCSSCHEPLSVTPSLAIPGMVLHPCGHSFHRFCAQTESCPICSVRQC